MQRGIVRISLAAVTAVVIVASMVGCSADPEPTSERSQATRAAICSGGGGGDECTGGDWCPPSCSICFTSIAAKIELMNRWECDPIDPGGGGGGEPAGCNAQQIAAAQESCRQICTYAAFTYVCGRVGEPPPPVGTQFCTSSDGIHYCRIVNGRPDYDCALNYRDCPRTAEE